MNISKKSKLFTSKKILAAILCLSMATSQAQAFSFKPLINMFSKAKTWVFNNPKTSITIALFGVIAALLAKKYIKPNNKPDKPGTPPNYPEGQTGPSSEQPGIQDNNNNHIQAQPVVEQKIQTVTPEPQQTQKPAEVAPQKTEPVVVIVPQIEPAPQAPVIVEKKEESLVKEVEKEAPITVLVYYFSEDQILRKFINGENGKGLLNDRKTKDPNCLKTIADLDEKEFYFTENESFFSESQKADLLLMVFCSSNSKFHIDKKLHLAKVRALSKKANNARVHLVRMQKHINETITKSSEIKEEGTENALLPISDTELTKSRDNFCAYHFAYWDGELQNNDIDNEVKELIKKDFHNLPRGENTVKISIEEILKNAQEKKNLDGNKKKTCYYIRNKKESKIDESFKELKAKMLEHPTKKLDLEKDCTFIDLGFLEDISLEGIKKIQEDGNSILLIGDLSSNDKFCIQRNQEEKIEHLGTITKKTILLLMIIQVNVSKNFEMQDIENENGGAIDKKILVSKNKARVAHFAVWSKMYGNNENQDKHNDSVKNQVIDFITE